MGSASSGGWGPLPPVHQWSCFTVSHPLAHGSPSDEEIIRQIHGGDTGGHLGAKKTVHKMKEQYYWPGHWNYVKLFCKTCTACNTQKGTTARPCVPLQSVQAGYPMQLVAMDIVGPFPESESGSKYILVVSDYYTKWVEAYSIANQEASTIARTLVDEFFCRFSPPRQLHSDQGRQFESEVIAQICRLLGIVKSRTSPYHPQSDGQVERINRTLLDMLATSANDHPWSWEWYGWYGFISLQYPEAPRGSCTTPGQVHLG